MSDLNVIRAWKDVKYRRGLSAAELAGLPQNPAGHVDVSHGELRKAGGFGGGVIQTTAITCTATMGGCCPGTTAATCTATFGGCCPPDL